MYLGEDRPTVTVHSELMDPVRILLVDDHLMVTEALASRLSAAMDLWVAGRCTTADPNLLDIVRGLRPDVITIEVEPLGPAVGEVLQGLVAARPEAKVVVLSADHDIAHGVEAARAGVSAWVAKEQGAAELETVIRGVCQGYSWFPPDMLGAILSELRADVGRAREHEDVLDMLSPRERDVLLSMMDGKRGRQIAQDLLISTDTVRTHTRNIFAKLDVHSRLEAVRVARAAGLRAPDRERVTSARGEKLVPGGRVRFMGDAAVRVATVITRLEGGAGQHALRGALIMDPAGYEMTIITGSGDPLLLDQAAAAGLEVLIEPALRAPIAPRSDLRALVRLRGLLTPPAPSTSCTRTRAKAGVLGRLAAHGAGVPRLVHTYHGFPFHEFQAPPRRQAYVRIERGLGRITDLALCVGTGVAVEAVRRGLISPERIRTIGVVADGPAPRDGRPRAVLPGSARARARAALGLPADATVVGAVGRLTYQKAPEDFVAALRALGRPGRDRGLGRWTGNWPGRSAAQARETPAVRVVLAGQRGNVPELLPAFDVFVLPSRYEGLPTAVVEAMMCGIPVVATAVNAVGDVVVPGETGLLVPPGHPALMADAVRFLLDSPEAAARMAAAAQARLGQRFGEPALRQALTAAYSGETGCRSLARAWLTVRYGLIR